MEKNNVFFIWGNEPFMIDEEIKKIVKMVTEEAGEEIEVEYIDADELSPLQLMETLEFSPLFALHRVAVIKNPAWLKKSPRKNVKTEEILQVLKDYLARDSSGQILVITAGEYNSTNPIAKLLNKEVKVINCKYPDKQFLNKWIKQEFSSRERAVNSGVVNLLSGSGQDMYYLRNLIEKLCLAVEEGTITEKDVLEELENKDEIKVFKLTDALLSRNMKASFRSYYQLREQGEHPIFFLYMIVRQFMALGKVKDCMEKGCTKQQIEEITGLKEFMVRKMMSYANNFSFQELRLLFRRFLEADVSFKSSSQNENIIMEALIVEICER